MKQKKGKEKAQRRNFVFDAFTNMDLQEIQQALRASSASEAIRYAIRKTAELIRYVEVGGIVRVEFSKINSSLFLDIPTCKQEKVWQIDNAPSLALATKDDEEKTSVQNFCADSSMPEDELGEETPSPTH